MLKKILIGIAAFVVVLIVVIVGGGLLLERRIVLDTSQPLQSDPSRVYPLLSSSSGLRAWWGQVPESKQFVLKEQHAPDKPDGTGLVVTFESREGQVFETWHVKEAAPPTRIVYEVDFAGLMTTTRILELTPGATGTPGSARWNETADIGNPLVRWMMKLSNRDDAVENRNVALRALDTAVAANASSN